MKKKDSVRLELWKLKVGLLNKAVEDKGLTLTFETAGEREDFLAYLNNFRASVRNNKLKHSSEYMLVNGLSFIRKDENGLIIAPNTKLSHNDKILLKVCNSL